jgi:1,2-diacylglycerol 3-alpha-glucosyltransferase
MKIIHIDFTGAYNEDMSYQEVIMPKYHAKDGHTVIMITTCYKINSQGEVCHTPPVDKIMETGVRLIRLEYVKFFSNYFTGIFRKVHGLNALLNQLLPDIIFFHCPQTVELLTVTRYVKKNRSICIYIDNHADKINSAPNWISRLVLHKIIWKYFVKKIEPYVTKFYGVTPLRCTFLKDMYKVSNDKIELLLMGADDDNIRLDQKEKIRQRIRNKLVLSDNDFVIITGGKIDEKKNVHLLMQAVCELPRDNVKLIIFGTPNQKMKATIEVLSKSDRIRNIGWIQSATVYDYFLASDLAVFPGTHSVLWEQSVGSGIPGVFRYWQGMDHVNVGENCKFLYEVNVEEIKRVLEVILNSKEEYKKMKKCSVDLGIIRFSYKNISRNAIKR